MDADRPVWDPPLARGRGRLPERASIGILRGGTTGVALPAALRYRPAWLDHPGGLAPFPGALLNPRDGEVNPPEAVGTLAQPVLDRVVEGVRVAGLEVGAGRVRLQLDSGDEVVAEAVVLATNGFT